MPYIDNVMAQLLGTTPMSNQMFLAGERQYLTFDFSSDAADMDWRLNTDTSFTALRMDLETTVKIIY